MTTSKACFSHSDLLLLPVWLLLTLLVYSPIHEGAHVLMARAFGWQLTEVQYIPRFWRGEILHSAIMRWQHEPEKQTPTAESLVAVAPYLVDCLIALVGVAFPLKIYACSRFHLWLLGLLFVAAPTLDTVGAYTGTFFTRTDLTTVVDYMGFPMMAVTFGISSVLLLYRFFSFISVFRPVASV